ELSATHVDGVVLVGVLKGSVPFLADLARALTIAPVVDFLAVSPYAEGTGRVRIVKDLDLDVTGRAVVLVEDVVDTGFTTTYLLGELRRRGARSVDVCALVDKVRRRVVPVPLRWVGFAVEEDYVVGYGLGHAERYRNLPLVAAADLAALRADPDALLEELYRG
ncbi:MAG TPA: phosphoribosyltransferase family protein, partial [Acidimicrobiales bacterium]|nr:phosphoribosyltransferase family protein [Acidimicrobiales bacterium]